MGRKISKHLKQGSSYFHTPSVENAMPIRHRRNVFKCMRQNLDKQVQTKFPHRSRFLMIGPYNGSCLGGPGFCGRYLQPLQIGIPTRARTDTVVHGVRRIVQNFGTDSAYDKLIVHFKNASNLVVVRLSWKPSGLFTEIGLCVVVFFSLSQLTPYVTALYNHLTVHRLGSSNRREHHSHYRSPYFLLTQGLQNHAIVAQVICLRLYF